VQLLEYLGAERAKQAKKLRTVAQDNGPSIRRNLKRLSKKVDRLAESPKSDRSRADIDNASALADIAGKLRFPKKLTKRNLHPYRLQVKELRYVLQLSEMQNQPELVGTLGEVKDAIGEWHDWEELVVIASDVLDDGPQASLVQQLKKISDEKFEQALSITNKMRSTYIDGKRRRTKSRRARSRDRSIPFPVSVARSAMQA
jgi:CHAD domain-containing protein